MKIETHKKPKAISATRKIDLSTIFLYGDYPLDAGTETDYIRAIERVFR